MSPQERAVATEKARRYADLTRKAAIRLDRPGSPVPFEVRHCLHDLANAVSELADVLKSLDGGRS